MIPRVSAAGVALALCVAGAALPPGALAAGPDWSTVPDREVMLFYPGQSSLEWTLVEAEHSGGPKIRKGKTCMECHAGEERKIGELIVSGEKLEPEPVAGRRAAIPVRMKTAHDGERLHVRLEWPRSTASIAKKLDPDFRLKATLMFTDDSVRAATLAGCWATCHDDLVHMPSDPADLDLTKYLSASRTQVTRSGGGASYKPQSALRELLTQGTFMEYWQVRANPEGPGRPLDGHVLEKRYENTEQPLVAATARREGDTWVAELSRALSVEREDRKDIVPGTTYVFGLAVHEQHADGRFHHVSFEHTLRLDEGEADFVAKKP